MIKFKGCPKCGGDLQLETDLYGKFLNCLQCGYLKDLPPAERKAPARQPVEAGTHRQAA